MSKLNILEKLKHVLESIKKRKKPTAIIIIIILIAALLGRRFILSRRLPELKTMTVERSSITQTIEVSGEISAQEQVDLHFQAAGKLTWLGVKEGDSVDKWQSVASLDKRTLYKQLKQDLIAFEKEYRDYEQAIDDNPLINHEFKRILEKAQFDLDNEVIDVEVRNLSIELANLISPIDGVVIDVDTPVAGVNVIATDAITIVNPESLFFEAEIDESDIASLRVGQKAVITLDSFPDDEIEAFVTWIDFSASISEGGGTVFLVKLSLPKIDNIFYRLGMNGDVSIIIAEKENSLILPIDAVGEDEAGTYVLVQENGELLKQPVITGLETDDEFEIVSGLEEGSQVILPDSLEDKVNVKDLRRGARVLRGR